MKAHVFRRWTGLLVVAMSMLGAGGSVAKAQPLADRVPGDALLYIGWRGVTDLGPGYDKSHLKAVIDASEMTKFMTEFVPALMSAEAKRTPMEAARFEATGLLVPTMYKRGGAFFIAQPDIRGEEVTPRLGLIVDAGTDAAALHAKMSALFETNRLRMGTTKQRVYRTGDLVVALIGYSDSEPGIAGETGGATTAPAARIEPLMNNAAFKSALKQVHESPQAIGYVNSADLLAMIDRAIAARGAAGVSQAQWRTATLALGVSGVTRAIATGALEGSDWGVRAFVESPTPRQGLATAIDHGPLGDATLALAPATSEFVLAGRFDGARLFNELRLAAAKIVASLRPPTTAPAGRPEDAKNQGLAVVDNAIMQIGSMIGLDLKADFFDALGDEWVMFSDRSIAGGGELSRVLVSKPRDPAKLDRAMSTLGQVIPGFLAIQAPQAGARAQVREIKSGNLVIHYVDAAPFTPAWTIHEGLFYAAAYPQVLVDAVPVVSAKGLSILTNKEFLAWRQRLAVERATGLAYLDLPQTVERSYPFALAASRIFLGEGLKRGVSGPALWVPPLAVLRRELTPSGWMTWTDDAGWRLRGVSPFPAAEIFSMQLATLLGGQLPINEPAPAPARPK